MRKKFDENYVVAEYLKGRTQKNIAEELGTYNTSIRRVLIRNNIKPRPNTVVQSIVKHNFLENLNDPSVNYWLGLLATDGCVTKRNTIVLDLQKRDKQILKDLIDFSGYPLSFLETTHKKTGIKSYRVAFSNEEMVLFLKSLGITRRKSKTLALKIDFNIDLLRGIIDGDGGFSRINKNKARLQIHSGSKVFAEQIFNYLKSLGFKPTLTCSTKNRKSIYYSVNMYRQDELKKLFNLLYKDAKYYIKRKYLKIGSLLGKLNNENAAKTGKL